MNDRMARTEQLALEVAREVAGVEGVRAHDVDAAFLEQRGLVVDVRRVVVVVVVAVVSLVAAVGTVLGADVVGHRHRATDRAVDE